MALARLYSRALLGMDSPLISVEVHASNGLPGLTIVGLPEASVRESRERVRSAILNSGFEMPLQRLTVNLAPADLPKSGGRYDLPIAVGILLASKQIALPQDSSIDGFEFFAELSLSGELRGVSGVLPSLLAAQSAQRQVILASENQQEVALLQQAQAQLDGASNCDRPVFIASHLREVAQMLSLSSPNPFVANFLGEDERAPSKCLSDIRGQLQAKRVLEVCASGGHSLLMVGEPGAGKTMLAERLPGILPKMRAQEALQTAAIHSIAGMPRDLENFFQRPFLSPHHSASMPAIIGGGSIPKPGAVSLASGGILFLDELPEFSRPVLEALREPLESKQVHVSRVHQQVSFPANFQLACALNPSPSGFFPDDPKGRCKDTPAEIARYLKKISGPLLDRIDCHLEVPAVEVAALQQPAGEISETSLEVRKRVTACQTRQLERQGCLNAVLENQPLQSLALDDAARTLLQSATKTLGLSARSYYRVLKLALTLADMQASEMTVSHIAEALSYRPSDRFKDIL